MLLSVERRVLGFLPALTLKEGSLESVSFVKNNCPFHFLLAFYDFSLCLLVMHIFLVIAFQNYITVSVFLTVSYTHIIYCDYIQLPLLLSTIFLPLLIPSPHLVPIRENDSFFPNTR